jgi:hypothetical protein
MGCSRKVRDQDPGEQTTAVVVDDSEPFSPNHRQMPDHYIQKISELMRKEFTYGERWDNETVGKRAIVFFWI